jgi:hypothetical protein
MVGMAGITGKLRRSRHLSEIRWPGLAEGRSRRGAGERHALTTSCLVHLSTNTNTHTYDIATMGALLSLPFLAMPAMGTVSIDMFPMNVRC